MSGQVLRAGGPPQRKFSLKRKRVTVILLIILKKTGVGITIVSDIVLYHSRSDKTKHFKFGLSETGMDIL